MTPSVPPEDAELEARPSTWWRPRYVVPLLVFAAAALGAVTFQLPYYAIAPGSALDVSRLVDVADGPAEQPEGQIFLTTVSLRRVTVLGAIAGWLDPAVDVVEQDVVVPPQARPADLTDFNLRLMDLSKQTAVGVAFEALDVDAITGDGAEVVTVLDDSPAEGVLEEGDVIVAVDGEEVSLHSEAVALIGGRGPGEEVVLTVRRSAGGAEEQVAVELAPREDGPSDQGFIGVMLQTRDLQFDFPFDVDIASERIGGPSAGLAFTLEVLDLLTEGELTGGRRIAATGTIELDGSVGSVGGVGQKATVVDRAGIELFLVPRDGYEAARRAADGDLRVEPVDDLADALAVLEETGGDGLGAPVAALSRA